MKRQLFARKPSAGVVIAGIVVIGVACLAFWLQFQGHAATPYISTEPENGTLKSPAALVTDPSASGGKAIGFNTPTTAATKVLLGHWDESPLRLNEVGGKVSNYNANKGVDTTMARVLGKPEPVSQFMKAYDGSWDTSYASSGVAKSAEFGHAFVVTMPAPGGGGNTGYSAVISGSQDSNIKAFFNSIPTTETAYVILQNEADNSKLGTDSTLYDKALAHIINVAAPIYEARGLKGGVGPVFMCWTFEYGGQDPKAFFQKWNYIQYIDASAKPYAFYAVDCYSKYTSMDASTYESIPNTVEKVFSQARALGVTRFGIGEFANSLEYRGGSDPIVGTAATQEKWINTEVPKIEAIKGLEFALYFHKPTGPESKDAQLLDTSTAKPFTAYAKLIEQNH